MYIVSAQKKRTPKIPVGKYTSVVKSIQYDESYANEEAVRIRYTLTDENGAQYEYSELFHNLDTNDRTVQFFDYLDSAGIANREDGLPDLVGFRETLVIKRRAGYSIPVIVERDVIW